MSSASKPSVWMPLYVGDWDADTAHLDCEQDGAYGRLIRHYWKNGAPVDDDAMLARIVRMERARWRRVRPAIAPFFEIRDGRWFHKRVEAELQRALQIIERRREAGRQGGRPKKQMVSPNESKPKANGLANGKQTETPARVTVDVLESQQLAETSQVTSQGDVSDSQANSGQATIIALAGKAVR